MVIFFRRVVAAIAIAACWLVCDGRIVLADDPAPSATPAAEAKPEAGTQPAAAPDLDVKVYEEFGQKLAEHIAAKDADAAGKMFDWDAFLATAMLGYGDKAEVETVKKTFAEGFMQGVGGPSGFFKNITAAAEHGGSYRFLRAREVDGKHRVVFRLLLGDGNLNYHEFVLAKVGDAEVKAVDVHVAVMGELLSETVRRTFLPIAKQSLKVEDGALTERDRDFLEHFPQTQEIITQSQQNNHAEVLKLYKALPKSLQEEKFMLMFRLKSAQASDNEEYTKVIDEIRTLFPNDPYTDLIAIDGFALKQQYDKAYECVERLDKSIGGDPYLKVLRANLLITQEKFDDANQMAAAAVAEEPKLVEAYWAQVTVSLKQQNYDKTVEVLNTLAMTFHLEFADLTKVPAYDGFVKSPQYQAWMESRQKPAE